MSSLLPNVNLFFFLYGFISPNFRPKKRKQSINEIENRSLFSENGKHSNFSMRSLKEIEVTETSKKKKYFFLINCFHFLLCSLTKISSYFCYKHLDFLKASPRIYYTSCTNNFVIQLEKKCYLQNSID